MNGKPTMIVFVVNGVTVRVWPRDPFAAIIKICTDDHDRALAIQNYMDEEGLIWGGLGTFYDR